MNSLKQITEEQKVKFNLTEEILNDYFFTNTFENTLPVEYQTIEESIEEALVEYNANGNGKLEARTQANRGFQLEAQRKMFSNR